MRRLFYEVIGAQRLIEIRRELTEVAREAVRVSNQLQNVGQASQPDVLEVEIEAQQSVIKLRHAESRLRRARAQLASVVGEPSIQEVPLIGNLEELPDIEFDQVGDSILESSPEIQKARAGITKAEYAVERAKVEEVPDIHARGGFRYSPLLGRDLRPIGPEGFFDVAIEVPIFDKSKGAVDAARADFQRAEHQAHRVTLSLRSRLATERQIFDDARVEVEQYKTQLLPRAREAYELYLSSFRNMAAAYPQVLILRRNLLQLREEYEEVLVRLHKSAVDIQGRLFTGGLDSPGRSLNHEIRH